jgi:arabinoxylan arabinofuranohydrolase
MLVISGLSNCPTDEPPPEIPEIPEPEKTTILDDTEFLLEAQPSSQDMATLFAALPANLSDSWKIWGHKNPLWTGNFGADPNILVYNDRLYVYASNDTLEYLDGDIDPNSSYGAGIQGLRIASSADLANWTDHGVVKPGGVPPSTNPLLLETDTPQVTPFETRSWAPTAAWKMINGKPKFFLYFANSGNGIGVITADSPSGPWTSPLNKLLIDRDTPTCATVEFLFDPSVFIDDDGQGYLYCGGGPPNVRDNGNARRVKLGADMISLAADPVQWAVPFLFEASDIKKINGRYYFSYSANSGYTGGGSIVYVTLLDPMSGFGANPTTYNPPTVLTTAATQLGSTDSNTHHAMFEFKGETYMIYHTQKAGEAMGVRRMRTPSIDYMPIKPNSPPNSSIDPVVMTRKGVDQVGKFDPYVPNEAETIGIQGGVYTRPAQGAGNGMVVTSIDTGDWVAVYGVDFGDDGAAKFAARVLTPTTPADYVGAIELRLDPTGAGITSDTGNLTPTSTARITGGTVIGRVQFKAKAGEEGKYAVTTIDFDAPVTGVHDLGFVFYSSLGVHPETIVPDSRHKNGFEFDEWQFFKAEE